MTDSQGFLCRSLGRRTLDGTNLSSSGFPLSYCPSEISVLSTDLSSPLNYELSISESRASIVKRYPLTILSCGPKPTAGISGPSTDVPGPHQTPTHLPVLASKKQISFLLYRSLWNKKSGLAFELWLTAHFSYSPGK